jgi:hypothetical protein
LSAGAGRVRVLQSGVQNRVRENKCIRRAHAWAYPIYIRIHIYIYIYIYIHIYIYIYISRTLYV